jgi:hypothetical protein
LPIVGVGFLAMTARPVTDGLHVYGCAACARSRKRSNVVKMT